MEKLIPFDKFEDKIKKRKCLLQSDQSKLSFLPKSTIYPPSFSLQAYCKSPYNQGHLGSCTANAICGLIKMTTHPLDTFDPSRLFLSLKELMNEHPNQPIQDVGANAADGCLIIATTGICPEVDMPYLMDENMNVINFGQPPSEQAMSNAALHIYPMFRDGTNDGPLLLFKTLFCRGSRSCWHSLSFLAL